MLRGTLAYKCEHAGIAYSQTKEAHSTETWSRCGSVSGPKVLEELAVTRSACGG